MHIDKLALEVRATARTPPAARRIIFNTITISDGISMGTEGMKYSLVSREVIADSIETVVGCEGMDGFVAIGGCDKNMPGCADGHRAHEPPRRVRLWRHDSARLRHAQGEQTRSRHRFRLRSRRPARNGEDSATRNSKPSRSCAIPGPGSCGGMYTANTMASAIEALGMSLPNSSAQNAISPAKMDDCRRAGAAVVNLLKLGIKPLDILTKKAFENAITVVIALGGSTNAVLHLLAIAHAAKVKLTIDDFTRIGKRVPVLADLKPSGKYLMTELVAIGGIRAAHEDAARRRPAPRRLPHRHRRGRWPRTSKDVAKPYPAGPDDHPSARRSDQKGQPPRHPLRQPRPEGAVGQNFRQGRTAASPAKPSCSSPRKTR